MVRWLIHRFPKLAKLHSILRAIEIIDKAISFYERLPKLVKWGGNFALGWLVSRIIQIQAVIWSWLEPNWRGFLTVFIPVLILIIFLLIRDIRRNRPLSLTENTLNNQERLNLEIRGRLGGNARILSTPEGDNPPWKLHNPLYAGGLFWRTNLLFVNKENQPINIVAKLAIPVRKDDPSRRFRVEPLNKPIYEHRDDVERYMYFWPEFLTFPVYIDAGKAVNGHVEFAIEGFQYNALGDSFTQIVGGHEYILEVEDLLSGKKAEFNL